MTFARELKCHRCGKTETVRTALIYYYLLPDDQQLSACAVPAWCLDCGGIRDVEGLPEVERLAEMLTDLETNGIDEQELNDKANFLGTAVDPIRAYADEYALRRAALDWRTNRVSQPRCLACGGTNHSSIQGMDASFEHPQCGGMLETVRSFHGLQGFHWLVDAEGNRLSDGCR